MSAISIKHRQPSDIPVSDSSPAAGSAATVVSSGASAGSCTANSVPVGAAASGEVETRGSGLISVSEVGSSSSGSGSGTGSGTGSGSGSAGFSSASVGSITAALSVFSGPVIEVVVSLGAKIELEGVVVDVVEKKIDGVVSVCNQHQLINYTGSLPPAHTICFRRDQ